MFFKKKDKGAAPEPKGKEKVEARREEARREEPRRQEPQREPKREPRRESQREAQRAPEPSRAQGVPAAPSTSRGPGASVDAALIARRGPRGAPVSPESLAAQTRAADMLASSSDPVDREAARAIAAGDVDNGLEALQGAAQGAGQRGVDRWRTLGALAFNVDAPRAKFAYEHLFNFQPRQFWDGIYLARLRGIGQQLEPAKEAANSALEAAANDAERAQARCELGLIAVAANDGPGALAHAEAAVALGKAASTPRDMVVRHVLMGDAALLTGEHPKARAAFTQALEGAKQLGAAAPSDVTLARGVCEVLEKCAAAAGSSKDHDAALKHVDEALNIRRRLSSALAPAEAKRGVAQTLNLKGELRRAANDASGAKAAFEEGLGLVRQISEASPRDPAAQRDHWGVLWRMASTTGAGVSWPQVVSTMERMQSAGALDQDGRRYLDEAKRRAAA